MLSYIMTLTQNGQNYGCLYDCIFLYPVYISDMGINAIVIVISQLY